MATGDIKRSGLLRASSRRYWNVEVLVPATVGMALERSRSSLLLSLPLMTWRAPMRWASSPLLAIGSLTNERNINVSSEAPN